MKQQTIIEMLILTGLSIVDYHYTKGILNAFLLGLIMFFTNDYVIIQNDTDSNKEQFDKEVENIGYLRFYTSYILLSVFETALKLFPIGLILAIL